MILPALVVAIALAAPAASKKTPAVVLVKSTGVPAVWREELRAAAEGVDLRTGPWVAPPAVSLEDAAAALGCTGWNDGCAGQIAGMTGAGLAVVIDVIGGAGGADLTVRVVTDEGKARGETRKLHVDGTGAADLDNAKAMVRAAVADRPVALVFIDTEMPGATVRIDGAELGRTPITTPLAVEPGTRKMVLSQEGRAPLSVTLTLKPWQIFRESYVLGSVRPDPTIEPTVGVPTTTEPPSAAAEEPPPGTAPVIGYVAAGVGGAVALVGLWFTTAWVSGYFEALGHSSRDEDFSLCLGLCDDATGIGIGITKGDRQAFKDGSYSAWLGASIATVGVGALLGATGLWLALSSDEPDEAAGTTAP